jgi:hypothetical protein
MNPDLMTFQRAQEAFKPRNLNDSNQLSLQKHLAEKTLTVNVKQKDKRVKQPQGPTSLIITSMNKHLSSNFSRSGIPILATLKISDSSYTNFLICLLLKKNKIKYYSIKLKMSYASVYFYIFKVFLKFLIFLIFFTLN